MVFVKKGLFVILFVFLVVLNSCTTTKLKSVWKDTAFDGHITTIMVAGVAPRHDVREFFEKEFVEQFKKVGVEAMTSVEAISSEDQLKANVIL